MKMFALHTMSIDLCNDNFELGGVKIFKNFQDATVERDQIIMELRDDWDLEEDAVEVMDNGNANIALGSDAFYEIQIQEVEI